MKPVKTLVGSGDRIGLFFLPFVIAGLAVNVLFPSVFATPQSIVTTGVGGVLLALGLVNWAWSVALILTQVPRGRLITRGPYSIVKHPLYSGVSLLVLPGLGLLLGTWLGPLFGVVLYVGSRIFAPDEERALAATFSADWDAYVKRVRVSWL